MMGEGKGARGPSGSRLLMISSDRAVAAGRRGAFWNTLSGFHRFWDGIDIICPPLSDPPAALRVFGNVTFHPLPRRRVPFALQVLREGSRLCRERRPDLIAVHSYGFQRLAIGGLLLARRTKVPLAVEVHHIEGHPRPSGLIDRLRKVAQLRFLRIASKRATAFRVVNQAELVPLLRSLGIPDDRILILYSVYLDRSVFRPDPSARKVYDMIFVGRLASNKGLPTLLDAFELIRARRPEASFLIVGQGPAEEWLRLEVDRRGLGGVRHVRWVDQPADLARLYRQSRVVVCASTAEGGPRVVIEGMACGLPAVSTPVGVMSEVIRDGVNGYLTSSWSAQELALGVLSLLEDGELYARCATAATQVGERFDRSKTLRAYAMGYRSLVGRASTARATPGDESRADQPEPMGST
jgi:glycosyltransferase involved in cell wall biosynthesis